MHLDRLNTCSHPPRTSLANTRCCGAECLCRVLVCKHIESREPATAALRGRPSLTRLLVEQRPANVLRDRLGGRQVLLREPLLTEEAVGNVQAQAVDVRLAG